MVNQCHVCGVKFKDEKTLEKHLDRGCIEKQKLVIGKKIASRLDDLDDVCGKLMEVSDRLEWINESLGAIRDELMEEDERKDKESNIHNLTG